MNREIENRLIQKKVNPTSMRILVFDLLAEQDTALSLSEIHNHFQHADRVTIYRTLKTFEKKGVVHGIQENNTTKYSLCDDLCTEETHKDLHLHFYCKICKETTCREDFLIPENLDTDFRIDEVRFFAKGICEKCLNDGLQ